MDEFEECARCGHIPLGCPNCEYNDPFLGGHVNGRAYCHTFSRARPTCYEVASSGLGRRVTGYASKYML